MRRQIMSQFIHSMFYLLFLHIGFSFCQVDLNNVSEAEPLPSGKFCLFAFNEWIFQDILAEFAPSANFIGPGYLKQNMIGMPCGDDSQDSGKSYCYKNVWGAVYILDQSDYSAVLQQSESNHEKAYVSFEEIVVVNSEGKGMLCMTTDLGALPGNNPLGKYSNLDSNFDLDRSYYDQLASLGVPDDYVNGLKCLSTADQNTPPIIPIDNIPSGNVPSTIPVPVVSNNPPRVVFRRGKDGGVVPPMVLQSPPVSIVPITPTVGIVDQPVVVPTAPTLPTVNTPVTSGTTVVIAHDETEHVVQRVISHENALGKGSVRSIVVTPLNSNTSPPVVKIPQTTTTTPTDVIPTTDQSPTVPLEITNTIEHFTIESAIVTRQTTITSNTGGTTNQKPNVVVNPLTSNTPVPETEHVPQPMFTLEGIGSPSTLPCENFVNGQMPQPMFTLEGITSGHPPVTVSPTPPMDQGPMFTLEGITPTTSTNNGVQPPMFSFENSPPVPTQTSPTVPSAPLPEPPTIVIDTPELPQVPPGEHMPLPMFTLEGISNPTTLPCEQFANGNIPQPMFSLDDIPSRTSNLGSTINNSEPPSVTVTETTVIEQTITESQTHEEVVVVVPPPSRLEMRGGKGRGMIKIPSPKPIVTVPVISEPVISPVVSEPVISPPVVLVPAVSEPITSEPVVSEPIAPSPIASPPEITPPVIAPHVIPPPVVPPPVIPEPVIPPPIVPVPVTQPNLVSTENTFTTQEIRTEHTEIQTEHIEISGQATGTTNTNNMSDTIVTDSQISTRFADSNSAQTLLAPPPPPIVNYKPISAIPGFSVAYHYPKFSHILSPELMPSHQEAIYNPEDFIPGFVFGIGVSLY